MIKHRSKRGLAFLCALVLTAAAACGGDDSESDDTAAATTAATEDTATDTTAATDDTTEDTATETTEATDDTTEDTATETTAGGGGGDLEALGLWDNGPCDESLDPYPIGTQNVFESPVLTLKDDVTALQASVDAFNARGGVGGHCMDLTTCDSEGDPNKEVDCARELTGSVVATLSDVSPFNTASTLAVYEEAQVPRFVISPSTQELGAEATMSFAIDAGGTGTTFVMLPGCTKNGHTKIAVIHVDTPAIGALFDAMAGMLGAYGAEITAKLPVPAGTTDYQQFILAAEASGATCIMLPLGENESKQVLAAAAQLGTDLAISMSGGTLGQADVAELGDFGGQIIFNAGYPPITASTEDYPVLEVALADLAASGDPALAAEELKTSPFRSWLAVYAFVYTIENFGTPDDISKESVLAAIKAAKDIPMFDLTPAWTPTGYALPGTPFGAVSQPWYRVWTFDTDAGNWVIQPDQVNVVNELTGQIDYPQP